MPEHNKKHDTGQDTQSVASTDPLMSTQESKLKAPDIVPLRKEFFWQIPGDVPGAKRVWPGLVSTQRISDTTSEPDSSSSNQAKGNVASITLEKNAEPANPVKLNKTRSGSNAFRFRWLGLLLIMALAVFGYNSIFDSSEPPVAVATVNHASQSIAVEAVASEINTAKQQSTTSAPTLQNSPRYITHVVVKGDTLWDLAKKYVDDPFRYPELAALSNIKDPHWIYPGDIIRIQIS